MMHIPSSAEYLKYKERGYINMYLNINLYIYLVMSALSYQIQWEGRFKKKSNPAFLFGAP